MRYFPRMNRNIGFCIFVIQTLPSMSYRTARVSLCIVDSFYNFNGFVDF